MKYKHRLYQCCALLYPEQSASQLQTCMLLFNDTISCLGHHSRESARARHTATNLYRERPGRRIGGKGTRDDGWKRSAKGWGLKVGFESRARQVKIHKQRLRRSRATLQQGKQDRIDMESCALPEYLHSPAIAVYFTLSLFPPWVWLQLLSRYLQ